MRTLGLSASAIVVTIALAAAPEPAGNAAPPSVAAPGEPEASGGEDLERARAAASAFATELMGRLMKELAGGGPGHALKVCSDVAPEIARQHSRDGLTVRRVTLKTRNSANAPDVWEREQLSRMEAKAASGEKPEETVATVDGDLRLLRPVFVAKPCLACHGDPASLVPEVKGVLSERYPADQATGYREGDLRGAVSVRIDRP